MKFPSTNECIKNCNMFTMRSDSGMKKNNHADFQNLPDTRYNPNEGSKQDQKDKNHMTFTYRCDLHMHTHDLTGKQKQTQKLENQIYGYHGGKRWTTGKLGGKAKQIQTITYKAQNPKKKKKQYLPRELYPTLCINLHGKRIQTCIAICICVIVKVSVHRQHIQHYCNIIPNNGEGNGTPLQYSYLENPMDGGAWWAAVHGVAKSQTRLSDLAAASAYQIN